MLSIVAGSLEPALLYGSVKLMLLQNWVCQSLVCVVRMFLAQRNSLAVCSWLLEFILALACFAAAICRFSLLLFAAGVGAS